MPTPAEMHELDYQRLRAEGQAGWGGVTCPKRTEGWRKTYETLSARPEFPRPPARILELGCGTGGFLVPFAEAGYEAHGVDFSPTAIAWAQAEFSTRGLKGRFQVGDLTRGTREADQGFDAILDGACFHCVIGKDRRAFLTEVRRILKPGGFLLISSMVGVPRELPAGTQYDPRSRTQIREGRPYRFMPEPEDLREELAAFGFREIHADLRRNPWWDHLELHLLG